MAPWIPSPSDTPYHRLGEEACRRLAARFYDVMDEREPALVAIHEQEPAGQVSPGSRARFAEFLVEWLGGPKGYSTVHGHPRLRMRHARVRVDAAQRDAWLRCMRAAMDEVVSDAEVRAFLDLRFTELADFLRNAEG
jgi:hemoglobin